MIKIRAWGLWAGVALMMTAACGSSSSSNSTGTGGKHTTATSTTSVTVGSGGSGGGTVDPICSNPMAMVSSTCNDCLAGITNADPCISAFAMACKGSAECVAFNNCAFGCSHMDGATGGAGGGGATCLAGDAMGGAGGAANNCFSCCENANQAGVTAFNNDFIQACVCTAGATCASACAM